MLFIGSHALEVVRPDLLTRPVGDVDRVCSFEDFQSIVKHFRPSELIGIVPISGGRKYVVRPKIGIPMEFEITWPGSTGEELYHLVQRHPHLRGGYTTGRHYYASLDVLFTLKSSHRFAQTKYFHKTMADWRHFKDAGAKIPPELTAWYKRRTTEQLQKHHPKLNVTSAEFFNPGELDYVYDHDSIHRAVAYGEKPVYTYYLEPGSQVKCSRQLFEALPLEMRLQSVAEESYVLSIERSHVPHGTLSPRKAFDIAIQRVCTVISSGWWREFAYTHFHEVVARYRDDYLIRFNAALAAGKIPPFKGSKYASDQVG